MLFTSLCPGSNNFPSYVDFTCAKVVEKPEFAKSTTPPACQSLKPCSQYCPMALATAKSKLPQKGPSSATGYPFSCKPFYEFSVFSCSKSFDSPPPQKYQFVFVYKLVENRKNVSVYMQLHGLLVTLKYLTQSTLFAFCSTLF
jgi:hypothetical protein